MASMNTINKIHVNSSTKLSLNDRFTIMQSDHNSGPSVRRNRSRSRSRSRQQMSNYENVKNIPSKASQRSRNFLAQLEHKHTVQAALRLKRRSLRTNFTPNQRLTNRIRNRNALKRTAVKTIKLTPGGRLRRTNSLSNIATMNADLLINNNNNGGGRNYGRRTLKRSNSTSSLAGRLGYRSGQQSHHQQQQQQQQQRQQRQRSRSRGRRDLSRNGRGTNNVGATTGILQRRRINRTNLTRQNSRTNLTRQNSQTNLTRQNSRTNVTRQRSLTRRSNSRLNLATGGTPRSNSRVRRNSNVQNLNRFNGTRRRNFGGVGGGDGSVGKRRNLLGNNRRGGGVITTRQRNVSVNSRLGLNRTNQSINAGERLGRSRGRNVTQRLGRSRSRNATTNVRNRSRSRSRNNRPGNQQIRGRGRDRSRGPGRSVSVKQPTKSKEELDKELEQYMANSKSSLDNEMDQYMRNI